MRLQKFLANAGVASRRKAEALIQAGRVAVNGHVVTELGTRIDAATDTIVVDGRKILETESVWIALHKPGGYVSTRADPHGRPTIYELLPESLHALNYVGRLDVESEGLMLLTNDGDGAHRLLHPSFQVARVYDVLVSGAVGSDVVQRLLSGVELEDGVARAESVEVLPARGTGGSALRLVLREGRKREVRRMLRAVGHNVRRLMRVSYGPIQLGRLAPGKWRRLSAAELRALPSGSRAE